MTVPFDDDEWQRDRPNLSEWDYAAVEDRENFDDMHN